MSSASDPIFAKIARRYDRVNTVLSLGREQSWRHRAAAHLPEGTILDLGSGTGAALEVFDERRVVAVDPVVEMLRLNPIWERAAGVGEDLPFGDETFDGVFSAFVFRNLASVSATLSEARRVLRPRGRLVVVDLARPRSPAWRRIHQTGTSIVLPAVGAVMAGAPDEYRYLHNSLDSLPPPEQLFEGGPLRLDRVSRMGINGFVYLAVMSKPG